MRNFSTIKKAAVSIFAMSALCLAMTSQAQAVSVDLELSLVWDGSGSISTSEYDLQRQGYGNAFQNQAVKDAIDAGTHGQIAVQIVQYGTNSIVSLVDGQLWTLVDSSNADAFGALLANLTRENTGGWTGIAGGIQVAAANLLSANGFEGTRMVMDVSGDGEENVSTDGAVQTQRDLAVGNGITINGLPILSDFPNLDTYYTNNVIGGPDSFVIAANGFSDFEDAVTQKLAYEISGTETPEPSTMILLGSGLVGLVAWRMKKQA